MKNYIFYYLVSGFLLLHVAHSEESRLLKSSGSRITTAANADGIRPEDYKKLTNFDLNTNGCYKASDKSNACTNFKNNLAGHEFDETVTLPNDWGRSIEERRREAVETYKMVFSPSFSYRVKSCFGFCAGKEKNQDTLSNTDGTRSPKESEAVHDTIAAPERSFYEGADGKLR